jgi:signal transduction histidine kinase
MPGAGTAGTARAAMLDGSRWPAYRPASESEDCRLGGKGPANELTGFNVQSRPPGRAPEGLEGSRRGKMSIAGGRDRGEKSRRDSSRSLAAFVGGGGEKGGFLFWLGRLETDESSESKDADGVCRCYLCMGRSVDVDILGEVSTVVSFARLSQKLRAQREMRERRGKSVAGEVRARRERRRKRSRPRIAQEVHDL